MRGSTSRGSITLIADGVFSSDQADTDPIAGTLSLTDRLPPELKFLASVVASESSHNRLLEQCVLSACYPDLKPDSLPVAALSYRGDVKAEAADDGRLLRCDPVYLKPGGRGLSFELPRSADLSGTDSTAIAHCVSEALADFDLQLEATSPIRWYVSMPSESDVRFFAPWVVGREGLAQSMPEGTDSGRWIGAMTACQIALHSAPVNAQREARGLAPVTGIWFWGSGQVDGLDTPGFDRIFASQGLARGLAEYFNRALDSLPAAPVSDALLLVYEDDQSASDAGLFDVLADQWRNDYLSSLTIVDPEVGEITFNADLQSGTGILGRWRNRLLRR